MTDSPSKLPIGSLVHDTEGSPSPMKNDKSGMTTKFKISNEGKNTFMTGLKLEPVPQKMDEIKQYHSKILDEIEKIDEKNLAIIKQHENDFLQAYKDQMYHVQKELKVLKKKIDEETLKRKADERMNILEQERDWFRAEAIRLDKLCKEQQKVIQDLKFRLKVISDDKNYIEDVVMQTKKENKVLKEELNSDMRKSVDDLSERNHFHSNTGRGKTFSNSKELTGDKRSRYDNSAPNTPEQKNRNMSPSLDDKMVEVIKALKEESEKDKKLIKQLKSDKASMTSKRAELEHVLMDAIDCVKRDISKRKTMMNLKELNRVPGLPEEIDYSKFTGRDKKALIEYFLSNDIILEELYGIVFNHPIPNSSPDEKKMMMQSLSNLRSEPRMKYSFHSGFEGTSIRLGSNLPHVEFQTRAYASTDGGKFKTKKGGFL